jgi:hypothetical protein
VKFYSCFRVHYLFALSVSLCMSFGFDVLDGLGFLFRVVLILISCH